MVEVKPKEYRAICQVAGEPIIDIVADQSWSTAEFWKNLDARLSPAERTALQQALKEPA